MRTINVALFISEFEDPYTNNLCLGVAKAVKEQGYNLYIFPGKFLDRKHTKRMDSDYEYQSNILFQFLTENHIDIALVNLGNIASRLTFEEKMRFLEALTVPSILISDNIEGFSSVNFDNSTGFMAGIEHLMRDHRAKYFGYVSGPKHNLDAIERLEVFEETMIRNRFVSEQYRIVEGDFSYSCTDVIEKLLDDFPQMQALICGNDMMCFAAYQVLEKRGLIPGRDIAVMGFDDVPYASQLSPRLTTVRADAALLGYEAARICKHVLFGETHNLMVDTSLVIRESCGCERTQKEEKRDILDVQANIEALNHCLVDISRNVLNSDEENNQIYKMILRSLGRLKVKSVYMYTFEEEMEYHAGDTWMHPESVLLRAYFRREKDPEPEIAYQPMPVYYYPVAEEDIVEIPKEKQKIPFDQIYSNEYMKGQGKGSTIQVTSMLYAGEVQYGFVVWEVEEDYFGYIGKLSYQISNAIKTNRLLQKKSQMATELSDALSEVKEKNAILEEISKVDELTQIYNRRGFLDHMKRNVIAKENRGKKAIAIYADMNDLKLVNDEFGHEEGDYSLISIGQMLREGIHSIEGKGEVGRIGGDEFCAYIITDEEDSEAKLRKKIEEITASLNRTNDKPYYVGMSMGMHHFVCDEDVDVSAQLEQADAQLYIYKQNKPKGIRK